MKTEHRERLESDYKTPDPWGFKTHPDDATRKAIILRALEPAHFETALDYGCGEGWLTKDLPAHQIYGWDLITVAMDRCPENVVRWDRRLPASFGLVVATGVLYEWYDGAQTVDLLRSIAGDTILTCHMEHHEIAEVSRLGTQVLIHRFAYRGMTEVLRIFKR